MPFHLSICHLSRIYTRLSVTDGLFHLSLSVTICHGAES